MPTSYTSLLGLALPVTGELQGTWGDTVNNSITSLLDSAIAGTTTLSTDADVTLTTTTGASNQARQAVLLCTGARTALRTITAPAQSKIYVVINNTSGGFGVKLVGAGPTTGVTIGNNISAVVAWDGADFEILASSDYITASNTATLTNKRITPRVSSTTTTASPFAWNGDNFDEFAFTALANALTINADAGTPTDGQKVIFRIKDNGTSQNLTWTTGTSKSFRAVGVTLPTATTVNKTVYVGCIYNTADSRWDAVAVATEA